VFFASRDNRYQGKQCKHVKFHFYKMSNCLIHSTNDVDTLITFNSTTWSTTVSFAKQWKLLDGVEKAVADTIDIDSTEPPAEAGKHAA